MSKWILPTILACMVVGQPAWAARTAIHEAAESPVYREKVGGMLGRGLLNAVTSFMDVIVNVVNETKSGPPIAGPLQGLGRGLGCGLLRFGSGVVDVFTFWVPGFNGFPVSDSYDDCFDVSSGYTSLPSDFPGIPARTVSAEPLDPPDRVVRSKYSGGK